MAALAGMGIDNALIDIGGPEIPAMDGSAAPFLFLVECAGSVEQDAPRRAIKILRRVMVRDGEKVAELLPGTGYSLEVAIDFEAAAIRRQRATLVMAGGAFKNEVGRARSFGFEQEVAALRAAGLALGGSLDNAVVISSDGRRVLNEEGLRFEDEFVRHKILDAVGDLSLAGAPIVGISAASAAAMRSTIICCAPCSPTPRPGPGCRWSRPTCGPRPTTFPATPPPRRPDATPPPLNRAE